MSENKIYVGNLTYEVTTDDIENLFNKFDGFVKAIVITDRDSGRSKGFGFVEYDNGESVKKAIEELNGTDLQGRALNVNEARAKEDKTRGGGRGGYSDRRGPGGGGGRGRY